MGIFTTALRDEKISQILTKNIVENLEWDNTLKWFPFHVVSGQAMHCGIKVGYFLWEFDIFFYSLERS